MTDRYQELLEAARVYHPSKTGIHVCGFDAMDSPITVLNFALEESIAMEKFAVIKSKKSSMSDMAEKYRNCFNTCLLLHIASHIAFVIAYCPINCLTHCLHGQTVHVRAKTCNQQRCSSQARRLCPRQRFLVFLQ
jgi:hypothetical protein